ncbi:MAG: hypothetical protein K2K81_08565 [Muribaculaceae bacterium]|nr:hypothetical protein [Muribaculaceae bacterium]
MAILRKTFIDVQSHGEFDRWLFGEKDEYTSADAEGNLNPNYSIITTNVMNNVNVAVHASTEEKSVRIDTSRLDKGFYVLSLYIDGFINDSKRFLVE